MLRREEELTGCAIAVLGATPTQRWSTIGLDTLAAHCACALDARLARPPRAGEDWSIEPPRGCDCELCGELRFFLEDRSPGAWSGRLPRTDAPTYTAASTPPRSRGPSDPTDRPAVHPRPEQDRRALQPRTPAAPPRRERPRMASTEAICRHLAIALTGRHLNHEAVTAIERLHGTLHASVSDSSSPWRAPSRPQPSSPGQAS